MARRFDLARRLEAVHAPDSPLVATRALRAEVNDPVWFLGRQWQLGEHRGEDAAYPVRVEVSAVETPITHSRRGPEYDPRVSPPETVIESEPEQWWTRGRRVRVGLALFDEVPPDRRDDPSLLLSGLAAPYDRLNGRGLDGLALFRSRASLGLSLSLFTEMGVPEDEPDDDWQPTALHYQAEFSAGTVTLRIPRHDGGDVDWFSATGLGAVTTAGDPVVRTSHPTRVTYPGVPAPRWWQIDDHRLDAGAVAPHRTHLSALLMIHVTATQHDDWFTAPLVTSVGSLVTVDRLEVRDSMDLVATASPVGDWSLFRVGGLGPESLLVWPTVSGPVTAPASLDDVLVGVDEDANVLWAVEQRVDGSDVGAVVPPSPPVPDDEVPAGQVVVTGRPSYRYLPSSVTPPFWHPYLLADDGVLRRFVQARLADLTTRPVTLEPGPTSRLLRTPDAASDEPFHMIDVAAIPRRGLHLERRYLLGRRTDGLPVLWIQRRVTPLQAPPVSGLLFDVLEEVLDVAGS